MTAETMSAADAVELADALRHWETGEIYQHSRWLEGLVRAHAAAVSATPDVREAINSAAFKALGDSLSPWSDWSGFADAIAAIYAPLIAAAKTKPVDAEPVAWRHTNESGSYSDVKKWRLDQSDIKRGWTETPLYDPAAFAAAEARAFAAGARQMREEAERVADQAAEQTECHVGGVDPSTGIFECSLSVHGKDCLCSERQESAAEIARAIRALPLPDAAPQDLEEPDLDCACGGGSGFHHTLCPYGREEREPTPTPPQDVEAAVVMPDLPWRVKDIQRGLILFRTSNNAHGHVNYEALSAKVDALPQVAKNELAAIMRNLAIDLEEGSVS